MTSNNLAHKVLVVDDDSDITEFLVVLLQDHINVSFATNGPKALELARSQRPDLILLDVMMPDMDGFEVCKRLKSDSETSGIPIIFLTALEDERYITAGLKLGAIDYITKPFNQENVLAKVRNQLDHLSRTRVGATPAAGRRASDAANQDRRGSKPPKMKRSLVVVSLGIFLLAVGGIAWMTGVFPFASPTAPSIHPRSTATYSKKINLGITATCEEGKVTFKVTNKGKRWPKTGTFRIYRLDNETVIVTRKLQLAYKQTATFSTLKDKLGAGGAGLWVKPSWYSRDFSYDAIVNCG